MDHSSLAKHHTHGNTRRSLLAGLVGIVLTVGLTATAPSAQAATRTTSVETAATSGVTASALADMQAQQPLSDAAQQIQDAIAASRATGFTGMALEADALRLYWKQGVATTPAVAGAIATARRTVPVRVTGLDSSEVAAAG